MHLFEDIVKESMLLTEINQSRERDIIDAIKSMKRMRISYDDKKGGKGKKERFIFPVAYGLTKAGNKAIRAFQTTGSTKRGVPKWKLFRLDRIYSMSKGKRSFKDYAQRLIDRGFNINGDNSMTTIYAISPLASSTVQVSQTTDDRFDGPSIKNDITPTTASQKPTVDQSSRFSSNRAQTTTNVDNQKTNTYIANRDDNMTTANDRPVTKDALVTTNTQQPEVEPELKTTSQPEIQPSPETDNNQETADAVKNDFNNMMDRMNNLYKDDEDINDNDEKDKI